MDRFLVSVRVRPLQTREKQQQSNAPRTSQGNNINTSFSGLETNNASSSQPSTSQSTTGIQPFWSLTKKTIYRTTVDPTRSDSQIFSFDHVFNENALQDEIYEKVAARVVEGAVQGICGTVFAYGQTSSGKTHTMYGTQTSPGIIPLAISHLFQCIAQAPARQFILKVSYIEIYNEKIIDLFADNDDPFSSNTSQPPIKIKEDARKGVFVSGVRELPVTSPQQIHALIEAGKHRRHISHTKMNVQSSRSHTILRFEIESIRANDPNSPIRWSALNLVDLAGSEKQRDSKCEGQRLKEGGHINKSLHILGKVIAKLSSDQANRVHVPFRESKLTRILEPSLGSSSRTSIICTVTPAPFHSEETLSTLKFGSRAKKISNKSAVNEIIQENMSKNQLEKELQEALNEKNLYLAQTFSLRSEVERQETEVEEQQRLMAELTEKHQQHLSNEMHLQRIVEENSALISSLKENLQFHTEKSQKLEQHCEELQAQILALEERLSAEKDTSAQLENQREMHEQHAAKLERELLSKDEFIAELTASRDILAQRCAEKDAALQEGQQHTASLQSQLQHSEQEVHVLNQQFLVASSQLQDALVQIEQFSQLSTSQIGALSERIRCAENQTVRVSAAFRDLNSHKTEIELHRDECLQQNHALQQQLADQHAAHSAQLEELHTTHLAELGMLNTRHDSLLQELHAQNDAHRAQMRSEAEAALASLTLHHNTEMSTTKDNFTMLVNILKEEHKTEIQTLRAQFEAHHLQSKDEFNAQLQQLTQNNESTVQKLKAQFEATLSTLQEQHITALNEQSLSHQDATDKLTQYYSNELLIANKVKEDALAELNTKNDHIETTLSQQISSLNNELVRQKMNHAVDVQQMMESHEKEMIALFQEHEAYIHHTHIEFETQMDQLKNAHNTALNELKSHYESLLCEKQLKYDVDQANSVEELQQELETLAHQAEETIQRNDRHFEETLQQYTFHHEKVQQESQMHIKRLEKELNSAKGQLAENRKQFIAEIAHLQTEHDDRMELARTRHEAVLTELTKAQLELEQLRLEHEENSERNMLHNNNLKMSNLALQADYETLHQNLCTQLGKHEQEREVLLTQVESTTRELELLREQHQHQLESLKEKYRTEFQQQQHQSTNLLERLEQVKHEERAQLKEELENAKMVSEALAEEKDMLLAQKSSLSDELARLKEQLQSVDNKMEETIGSESELKELAVTLQSELNHLREENARMQHDIHSTEAQLKERVEELEYKLKHMNHRYSQLETTYQSLQDAASQSDHTIKALQKDNQRAQQSLQQLESREETFNQMLREKDVQIQELSLTLKRAEESRDKLTSQVQQINSRHNEDAAQFSERTKLISQLKTKIDALQEEKEGIREHARDTERNLQREIRELKTLKKNFQMELAEISAQLKSNEDMVRNLKQEVEKRDEIVKSLTSEVEKMSDDHESELSFFTSRNEELCNKNAELRRELRKVQKEHLMASFKSSIGEGPSLKRKRVYQDGGAETLNADARSQMPPPQTRQFGGILHQNSKGLRKEKAVNIEMPSKGSATQQQENMPVFGAPLAATKLPLQQKSSQSGTTGNENARPPLRMIQ